MVRAWPSIPNKTKWEEIADRSPQWQVILNRVQDDIKVGESWMRDIPEWRAWEDIPRLYPFFEKYIQFLVEFLFERFLLKKTSGMLSYGVCVEMWFVLKKNRIRACSSACSVGLSKKMPVFSGTMVSSPRLLRVQWPAFHMPSPLPGQCQNHLPGNNNPRQFWRYSLPRYLTFFPKFNIFFRHSFESFFRSDPSPIITSLCFGRREKTRTARSIFLKYAKVRKQ